MAKTAQLKLIGTGVEAVEIPELDEKLTEYDKAKKRRVAASQKEIPLKEEVLALMHANEKKLRQANGTLAYRYDDDKLAVVTSSKEKIKITTIEDEEGGEEGGDE